jgi:acetyl-CoA acetyltransferase
MKTIRRIAIIGGGRIPFARQNSAYVDSSNIDMLTAVLKGVVERFGLQNQRPGAAAAGAVVNIRPLPISAARPRRRALYRRKRASTGRASCNDSSTSCATSR